jgi:predicted cupin superfamily sugar epimerase
MERLMKSAAEWIERLQLLRHPEGGYYRETYRSEEGIARAALPGRFTGDRSFSTAIYFLLAGTDFSALHRIKQDEVWHFYDGSALTVHVIDRAGNYSVLKMGRNIDAGEMLQGVVRAGCFFGATVSAPNSYALAGCTVAPGFDFADFEIPGRMRLLEAYPQHREIIEKLTRA